MSINRLLVVLLAALLLPGLALAQSSRATFAVTKDFSDNNPFATATVSILCNTGLPISRS